MNEGVQESRSDGRVREFISNHFGLSAYLLTFPDGRRAVMDSFLDRMAMRLAWWLPKKVAMWAFIRVMAHACQGRCGGEDPDSITYSMAYNRWSKKS